jgi:mannose-6-phosphate isomerase-like protein (cupin superfamily)
MSAVPIHTENAEHYSWGEGCDGWHLLRSVGLSVIQEKMPPYTSEVLHYHAEARQFFFVLSGALAILLPTGTVHVTRHHGLEIAPGVAHQVRNDAEQEAEFLVVSQPPSHGDRDNAAL